MSSLRLLTYLLTTCLVVGAAEAQFPQPIGLEFEVSTDPVEAYSNPLALMSDQGAFVMVWENEAADELLARRYDSSGSSLGGVFLANQSGGAQLNPDAAIAGGGDFAVVWQDHFWDAAKVRGQLFSSDGSFKGEEFLVGAADSTAHQESASVAMHDDGSFWVVWACDSDCGLGQNQAAIRGRRFSSTGDYIGAVIEMSSYMTYYQNDPAIGLDAAGNAVVVWSSAGSFGNDNIARSVQLRRFSSSGVAIGQEEQVNVWVGDEQGWASVAVADAGDFIVTWQSGSHYDEDNITFSIRARRYDSSGSPTADPFRVNTWFAGTQSRPKAAINDVGEFVIVWSSGWLYGGAATVSVQGQRFNADGSFRGTQFRLGERPFIREETPTVAVAPEGQFVVVWESRRSSTAGDYAIRARRFEMSAGSIFSNGFEGGVLEPWTRHEPMP